MERGKYILNKSQTGFRNGLGCELNILRLTEHIEMELEKKKSKRGWTLFVDLKSAFDSVDHQIVMEKMRKVGVKEEIRNIIA